MLQLRVASPTGARDATLSTERQRAQEAQLTVRLLTQERDALAEELRAVSKLCAAEFAASGTRSGACELHVFVSSL